MTNLRVKIFSIIQLKNTYRWIGVFFIYSLFLVLLFLIRFLSLDIVDNNYTIYHNIFCIYVITLLSSITVLIMSLHLGKDFLLLLLLPLGLCLTEAINQYGHFQMCTDIWGQVFHYTVFSISLITAKILLLSCCKRIIINKIIKFFFSFLESIFWLFIILVIANRILSGARLDTGAVDAICQTHFSEAVYYFFNYNNGYILSIIALILLILFLFFQVKFLKLTPFYPPLVKMTASFFIFILAFTILIGKKAHYFKNYMPNLYITLCEPYNYRKQLQKFTEENLQRKNFLNKLKQYQGAQMITSKENGLFVLIIGESICRNYMSCYGYSKPTTPYQDKLRRSGQAVFFENAYSSHVVTIHAVPMMLTAQNQYLSIEEKKVLEANISLLDIANINGYRTAWISNQQKKDFTITVIAQAANDLLYLQDENSKRHYDDDLVTVFQKLQGDWSHSFVIFHQAGTHFPYDYSYPSIHTPLPENFKSYDKAIYFNDENIEKLVESLKQHHASVIAYVSDHADAVSVGRAHDARPERFHKEMTEIPFWIYFSEEYQTTHPEVISMLRNNVKVPITNDIIYNLFLQLMNMTAPLSHPECSPTSPDFILKSQPIKTLDGSMTMQNGEWHSTK